tara:strand:+ start:518 stop:853 length:336 start_codon:yes stop_codon:yes gene_type:complete
MNAELKKNKQRLSNAQVKQYRAVAHQLNPVVTIGGGGVSEGVMQELDRALRDHELIKIKIAVGDRDARDAAIADLCSQCQATLIQRIGNTATLLRRNPQADPRKSNLMRSP